MSKEFTVVGEYDEDGGWLLVLGTDGKYYRYHPNRSQLIRVEPDDRVLRREDREVTENRWLRPKEKQPGQPSDA